MKSRILFPLLGILAIAPAFAGAAKVPAAPTIIAPSGALGSGAAPLISQHYNAFAYNASADSTSSTPGTSNLYRASGACPASLPSAMQTSGVVAPGWSLVSSGNAPSATSSAPVYDTNVSAGQQWSYVVTAVIGAESKPSSCVTATTPTFSVGSLSVVSN